MRFSKLFSLVTLFVLLFAVGCAKVDPTREVGVLVKTTGTKVLSPDSIALHRGRVFWNPITHDLHTYPITYQTVVWTADEQEGSPTNDSLSFTTLDKAQVNVDFSFTFAILPEAIPALYVKHRRSMPELTQAYVKSKVRAALNSVGENYKAEEIVGGNRTAFLRDVKEHLVEDLSDEGFVFDMVEIVNSPRLPPNVQNAINLALEATQNAQIAENQLRQISAEAQKSIEAARGNAEAVVIEAQAEAEANRILTLSLTDAVLRARAIEKWDGSYPTTVVGDGVPMIQIR